MKLNSSNYEIVSATPISMEDYLYERQKRKEKGLFVFDYITYTYPDREFTIFF